jgi:hypothetical protein
MAVRSTLLIGSLPFADEEQCMRRALQALGPALLSLPDGEVGEKSPALPRGTRADWVLFALQALSADREGWRVVREAVRDADGIPAGYDAVELLKPLRSPAQVAERVRFGYDLWVRKSYPVFRRLREEYGLPGLRFQLGVPTGFAMGFAFASKLDWIRYTGAFNTVIAREINAALDEAGEDLVVQLEIPPELYAAYLLPPPLLGLAELPVKNILPKIRPGARIGLHLCLGDFHNRALVHPAALDRMVSLANRLAADFTNLHRLEYVHFPLAEAAKPPSLDPAFYRPLQKVRLPPGARFVAGFVHERRSLGQNREILGIVEDLRGGPVDAAASCGLGRRTPEAAQQVLELMARLAA